MERGNASEADLSRAFAGVLEKKYSVTGVSPECRTAVSPADAQLQFKLWMDEATKYRYNYGETVKTGWTYTPPTSPPAPPP